MTREQARAAATRLERMRGIYEVAVVGDHISFFDGAELQTFWLERRGRRAWVTAVDWGTWHAFLVLGRWRMRRDHRRQANLLNALWPRGRWWEPGERSPHHCDRAPDLPGSKFDRTGLSFDQADFAALTLDELGGFSNPEVHQTAAITVTDEAETTVWVLTRTGVVVRFWSGDRGDFQARLSLDGRWQAEGDGPEWLEEVCEAIWPGGD